jgi:7-carboxy-7-deazaguanine synthase
MTDAKLEICETFTSLQGESSYAGMGCFFIRLAGCNLRCTYCDSRYAFEAQGRSVPVASLLAEAQAVSVPLIEVTGGEPLLQAATPLLLLGLLRIPGKTILVETNGSLDIACIPDGAVAIVDIKCPDSGATDSFSMANLDRLRPCDELKFVIASRADYEWASRFIRAHDAVWRAAAVHFSPVVTAGFAAEDLAAWIVEDGLPVRLQLQLHRILEMR